MLSVQKRDTVLQTSVEYRPRRFPFNFQFVLVLIAPHLYRFRPSDGMMRRHNLPSAPNVPNPDQPPATLLFLGWLQQRCRIRIIVILRNHTGHTHQDVAFL